MVDLECRAAFGELAGKEAISRIVDLELGVIGNKAVDQALGGRTSKSSAGRRRHRHSCAIQAAHPGHFF
jgi:hypothetical protein